MIVDEERMSRVRPDRIAAVRKSEDFKAIANVLSQMPDEVLEQLYERDAWIMHNLFLNESSCLLGHLNQIIGCSYWWAASFGRNPVCSPEGKLLPSGDSIPGQFDRLCERFGTGITVTALKQFIRHLK